MVKKLLILVLVLGVASTASAELSLRRNNQELPGTVGWVSGETVQVYSDDTAAWPGYVLLGVGGSGALGNGRVAETTAGQPGYPGDGGAIYGPYDYSGAPYYMGIGYLMQADFTVTPIEAGIQFLMELTGNIDDTGTVNFFAHDNFATPADSFDYTIIPEPMTIALLGLGGLLLRRRK